MQFKGSISKIELYLGVGFCYIFTGFKRKGKNKTNTQNQPYNIQLLIVQPLNTRFGAMLPLRPLSPLSLPVSEGSYLLSF